MKIFKCLRIRIPHVFVLLTGVILFCSLLTYIIPSGFYEREKQTVGSIERTVVIPGSYKHIEKHISLNSILLGDKVKDKATPVSFIGFLSAIPLGMESASSIIFLIFIIGGVFGILQKTGTINAVIQALVNRYSNSGPILTIVIMITLGLGGSTIGMGEELIPLVPIFLLVSNKFGYDRIYGLSMIYLSSSVGFAAATTNPFTVQIAQGIAQVQIGSGILFRMVFFVVCISTTLLYVLRYGRKIRLHPEKSLLYNMPLDLESIYQQKERLNRKHLMIVLSSALIFVLMIYFIQTKGWWLAEMSGGFILIGIIAVFLSGLSIHEANKSFIKGMEEMVVPALVVGFAKGIQVVLEDGQIMDSIIYYISGTISHLPKVMAAEGMFIFQSILNFFIPSGSGQAAVTMPLMAPISDVLGLSRQTAVLAFTSGDGFSNTIIPTSGILMAMLSLAHIPYEKWLRFMLPLFLQLMLISALFIAIAVLIGF
jgi:uncharacterized ion transporter superfamily protein YfcC